MMKKTISYLFVCLVFLFVAGCQPAGEDFQDLPNYQSPTPKATATPHTTAQEGKGPTPSPTVTLTTLPPTPAPTITLAAGVVEVGSSEDAPAGNTLDPDKITPGAVGSDEECKNCPTLVPTATITPTATISGTAQPTATPTLVPSSGPIFANTPVLPFDPQLFITHLMTVSNSFGGFIERWNPVLDGSRLRQQGDCEVYIVWYYFWTTEAPAFHDVPAGWQTIYYEYRVKLLDAANKTNLVRDICPEVEPDPDYNGRIQVDITGFFELAYPRLQEMIVEAQALLEE